MSGPVITMREIMRAAYYPVEPPRPFRVREYKEADIVLTMDQIASMKQSDFDRKKTYQVGNLTQLNFMPEYSCLGYDSQSSISGEVYNALIEARPKAERIGGNVRKFFASLGEETFTYNLEDGYKIVVTGDGGYKTVDKSGAVIYERDHCTLFGVGEIKPPNFMSIYYNFPLIPIQSK